MKQDTQTLALIVISSLVSLVAIGGSALFINSRIIAQQSQITQLQQKIGERDQQVMDALRKAGQSKADIEALQLALTSGTARIDALGQRITAIDQRIDSVEGQSTENHPVEVSRDQADEPDKAPVSPNAIPPHQNGLWTFRVNAVAINAVEPDTLKVKIHREEIRLLEQKMQTVKGDAARANAPYPENELRSITDRIADLERKVKALENQKPITETQLTGTDADGRLVSCYCLASNRPNTTVVGDIVTVTGNRERMDNINLVIRAAKVKETKAASK